MAKVSVRIDVALPEADADLIESAVIRLREELRSLDVDSIEAQKVGASSTGAKAGAELVAAGTLLLTIPRSALLSAVVEVVKSWAGRASGRTARIEIDGDVLDVHGLSSSQQKLLIEDWIARHNASDN